MNYEENNTVFDDSSYNKFLETLIDQIYLNRIHSTEKSMTVYIDVDYNSTNLRSDQIKDLLTTVRSLVNAQFSLLPISTRIIFSVLYGFILFLGLVLNSLMICTFYRAKKLKTTHNIFIINLAIR